MTGNNSQEPFLDKALFLERCIGIYGAPSSLCLIIKLPKQAHTVRAARRNEHLYTETQADRIA
jgi:hypothetical protein